MKRKARGTSTFRIAGPDDPIYSGGWILSFPGSLSRRTTSPPPETPETERDETERKGSPPPKGANTKGEAD